MQPSLGQFFIAAPEIVARRAMAKLLGRHPARVAATAANMIGKRKSCSRALMSSVDGEAVNPARAPRVVKRLLAAALAHMRRIP
jgi:hypothetical protein